jgi:hypothetical protein
VATDDAIHRASRYAVPPLVVSFLRPLRRLLLRVAY